MSRKVWSSLDAQARKRFGNTGQGVAVIMLATVAAQGIAFLGYPAIARLYTPHDFGTLTTVTAGSMLLMPVMAIRADALVPLPPSDTTSRAIVRRGITAVVVNTVLATIVAAGLFATGQDFALGIWIFAIPVVAALMALFQLANAWAIRLRRYNTIAGRNVIQALTTIIVQTVWGLVAASAFGLIAGLIIALTVSTLFLAVSNKPAGTGPAAANVSESSLDALATYTRQGPPLALAGLMNAAGLYTPPLLITAFFGLSTAGQFGLAQRVVAIPVALLGQATAQVYLGWIAENKRAGRPGALRALRKATRSLLIAALPMGLIVLVASPWAFPLVFGTRWGTAGSMAAALAVSLCAQLVAAPVSQTLIVLGHSRLQLLWDTTRLLLVVGSLLACVSLGLGAVATVWAFSLASTAAYVLSWGLSRWAACRDEPEEPVAQP